MKLKSVFCWVGILAVALGMGAAPRPTRAQTNIVYPFNGVWSSTICEPRPGGPFARRELVLENASFISTITSFADGKCTIPTIRIRIEGDFFQRGINPLNATITDVEFRWKKVFLTALTTPTADFLNTARQPSCGVPSWSVGATQDLEATKGCRMIGIDLRAAVTEFDIVTMNGNKLATGIRTDAGYFTDPTRRPLVFGPILVKTAEIYNDLIPMLPETGGVLAH